MGALTKGSIRLLGVVPIFALLVEAGRSVVLSENNFMYNTEPEKFILQCNSFTHEPQSITTGFDDFRVVAATVQPILTLTMQEPRLL